MTYEAEYQILNTILVFRNIVEVHWANGIFVENLLIAIYISGRHKLYYNLVVNTFNNQLSFYSVGMYLIFLILLLVQCYYWLPSNRVCIYKS